MRICGFLLSFVVVLGCSSSDDTSGDDAGPADATVDGAAPDALPPAATFELTPDPAESGECLPEPPAEGTVRAKHIGCDGELAEGPNAMGRVGDLMLENAKAKFIIRTGEEGATVLGGFAGTVVDAVPQGGADFLNELIPAFSLAGARPTGMAVTDAGADGSATVRVLFETDQIGYLHALLGDLVAAPGFQGSIDYTLDAGSGSLAIHVQMATREDTSRASGRPAFAVLAGASEMLKPGRGLLGEVVSDPTLGESSRVLGEANSAALAFSFVPDRGSVAAAVNITMASFSDNITVLRGEVASVDAVLGVGHTEAEAWNAIQDPEDPGLSVLTLEGQPGDRVDVRQPGGLPMVRTRLDAAGRTEVLLPPRDYEVKRGTGHFFPGAPVAVTLASTGSTAALGPASLGTLRVLATAGGDAGAPVRVTVTDLTDAEVERFVAIGPTERRLPLGTYRVTVSRGHEYDAYVEEVSVTDQQVAVVSAVIDRLVDTAGWVAGDFHVHSEMSIDSEHALDSAVRLMAGEGLEVVASTDHDFLTDYAPFVEAAGLSSYVLTVVGDELSHPAIGHIGGYPLARDLSRSGAGAPQWFGLSPGDWFDMLRALGADENPIVQVNHPRRDGAGFFESIALDRATGLPTRDPADLGLDPATNLADFDFEAIEVWNKNVNAEDEEALLDYLALYGLGRRFTMMGNSDTHEPGRPVGTPRSYIRVPEDTPGAFTWADVAAGIRAGEVTVSGGIFVTATVDGPPVADMAAVSVRIQAAPWADVDRLRVYAGTTVALDMPLGPVADTVRFEETLSVPLSGASFVVVRADGARAPTPIIAYPVFGITNPIDVP